MGMWRTGYRKIYGRRRKNVGRTQHRLRYWPPKCLYQTKWWNLGMREYLLRVLFRRWRAKLARTNLPSFRVPGNARKRYRRNPRKNPPRRNLHYLRPLWCNLGNGIRLCSRRWGQCQRFGRRSASGEDYVAIRFRVYHSFLHMVGRGAGLTGQQSLRRRSIRPGRRHPRRLQYGYDSLYGRRELRYRYCVRGCVCGYINGLPGSVGDLRPAINALPGWGTGFFWPSFFLGTRISGDNGYRIRRRPGDRFLPLVSYYLWHL